MERVRSMKDRLLPLLPESVRARAGISEPSTSGSPTDYEVPKTRDKQLRELLRSELIDMDNLRALVAIGDIDDNLRPVVWRLLLGYLPNQQHKWGEYLKKQRSTYEALVTELIVNASAETCPQDNGNNGVTESAKASISSEDHPLNTSTTSTWSQYFKDNEMLTQIDKDVRRLCPEMAFFQHPTLHPCKAVVGHGQEHKRLSHRILTQFADSQTLGRDRSGLTSLHADSRVEIVDQYMPLAAGEEAHWEVVERVLFLYYKLNPGVKYVQGMNEILGPLYYVLASDRDIEWSSHAEADTFYCYQNLMAEVKDHFIKTLDRSSVGIESTMQKLMTTLEYIDKPLYKKLVDEQQLVPQYYAFRWLSLLLSQEFHMPDVICIWDALFADEHRFDLLIYVCVAMLENARDALLHGEFSSNMKLLQSYPSVDVSRLIRLALHYQSQFLPRYANNHA